MKKKARLLNFTVDMLQLIIVDIYVQPTLVCELLEDGDHESCQIEI